MREKYWCDKCGKEFNNKEECLKHEESCNPMVTFKCDKCGKVITYSNAKDENGWDVDPFTKEGCWEIRLGRAGCGSSLDGSDVNFDLCDDCLVEFINSFTSEGLERVKNSGLSKVRDL